jgi:hypothetical protein
MPMFGDKKFPYTPAGKKAAKMYAKAEGMEDKAMKMGAKKTKKKAVKKAAKKAMPKKMGKKK